MNTHKPETCEALRTRLGSAAPEVTAHLAACPACRAVADAQLEISDATGPDDARLASLFDTIATDVTAETGPRAWLRSRPTWLRRALAVAVALTIAVLTLLTWRRVDLDVYPIGRLLGEIAAWSGLAVFGLVAVVRRSPHPAALGLTGMALGLALILPLLEGLLPAAHAAHVASVAGAGADLIPRALACLLWGTIMAIPMLGVLNAMSRDDLAVPMRAAVVGAVAGVTGVLALQLHCPITQPVHLIAGHASVVIVLVGGWLGWRRVAARGR